MTTKSKASKAKTPPKKSTANPKAAAKPSKPKYPHHPMNKFRAGSSYSVCFDVLSAHKTGLTRKDLIAKVAKVTGKPLKLALYDCSVLLSAKESNTGARHRSCPEGFWVKREADHVQLMID